MRYKLCEIIEADDKTYIQDYRIGTGRIQYITGRLKDLSELYLSSSGLGDLLGSVNFENQNLDELAIVEYKGSYGRKYAIGKLN